MTGLVKAKKYDWKDSNLALFGSDLEKDVKRASAETEEAWKGAGQKCGMAVWRIVKFKVECWPQDDIGKFYEGDSYIILHTYKNPDEDELLYDLFFWIGQYSTQDEYGTAAYKTVELDTFLQDKPIQHREVMKHESDLFKSLFTKFTLMKGGAATGFRHVKPEEYKPRLLKIAGTKKQIKLNEIPMKLCNVNSDDVFLLDKGLEIFVFLGKNCNKDERFKAAQYAQGLKSERSGKVRSTTLEERELAEYRTFKSEVEKCERLDDDDDDDDEEDVEEEDSTHLLFKLSDESGDLSFTEAKTGSISEEDFKSEDAYVLDTKTNLFVWIGNKTTNNESRQAMAYAHQYLMKTKHPLIPVTCVKEGRESQAFKSAIAA